MSRIKLKQIAIEKNERIDNPSQSSYTRFVGLEHYDSGEATIRRYGSTERLESTMKVFRAGDILVARRNVYLKRAATVDFDGLTSGDSIVLHIENEVYRRIIPFVLNTDEFWDYANQHADGSMSKRLSPKLLMEYEFSIPDDNLEQISSILWAMERVKTAYRELIAKTDELVKSQFIEMFGDPVTNPKGLPSKKLSSLASLITKGASPSWQGYSYTDDSSQTLFVTSENVREGTLDLSDPKYLEDGFNEKQARSMLKKGDFLINIVGASIGRAARFDRDCKANINQAVALVRMGQEEVLTDYMLYYLNSPKALEMYNGMKSAVARANLSLQNIGDLEIIIPPITEQQVFSRFLQQSDKSKFAVSNRNLSRSLEILKRMREGCL